MYEVLEKATLFERTLYKLTKDPGILESLKKKYSVIPIESSDNVDSSIISLNPNEKYLKWIKENKFSTCKFKIQMAYVVMDLGNQDNVMPTIRSIQKYIGIKTTCTHKLYKEFTLSGYLKRVGTGTRNTKYYVVWDKTEAVAFYNFIMSFNYELKNEKFKKSSLGRKIKLMKKSIDYHQRFEERLKKELEKI